MLRFAGQQNVIHPQNVKQCYVLRDPHLRFGYYAVEIIIMFCVKLLRFVLSSYVLGNVKFCGPTACLTKCLTMALQLVNIKSTNLQNRFTNRIDS